MNCGGCGGLPVWQVNGTNVNVTLEANCWLCQTGIKTSKRYSTGDTLCVVFLYLMIHPSVHYSGLKIKEVS